MDLISRQDAIDAVEFGITYAKAINKSTGEVKELFKEGNKALNEAVERIKDLPSAQPEPMSDLISKQSAIDAITDENIIRNMDSVVDSEMHRVKRSVHRIIASIPSALPERKNGKWLCSDDLYETAVCSCCGWDTTEPWQHIKSLFEFCPHCGADMRGEQDE